MNCDICGLERPWLEVVGKDLVCHACIQKGNPLIGKILRTHMDSFSRIMKKKGVKNFEEFRKLQREDIKDVVNVSRALNLKY